MNSYNILPPDVKKDVVRLYIEEGRTAESLALEYGIAKSSITRWARDFRKECQSDPTAKEELSQYELVNRLRQENAELRKENAFLKKAAAFFAKEIT